MPAWPAPARHGDDGCLARAHPQQPRAQANESRQEDHEAVAHDRARVEIDDRALLGATLDVVSSLRGQLDDVEALAYMRRAVSMLRSVEVPYWLGHALQNLGHVLLNLHGEPEEAAGLPSESRVLLQDCGDMHCWVLSQRETVQEWTRGPLDERLGDAEIDRLLAEGAAMDTDEALAIFPGWLLEVAV